VKKRYLFLFGLVPVLLTASLGLGITPRYIASAPAVSVGIGAKLLCSARYVSGYSEAQAFDDVVSYSPVLKALDVSFDDDHKVVTASVFGLKNMSASYRKGLGCALDFDGLNDREGVLIPELLPVDAAWPAGIHAPAINDELQARLENMVVSDNAQGFNTRALLVVKDGQLVAEAYGQGVTSKSQVLGWSMGKSLTAMLLGVLESEGRLPEAEQPLFASWASDERAALRLEDLLTMSSGLNFSEVYQPGGDATAMLFVEPNAAAYAEQSLLLNKPGEHFSYSSGTTNLLASLYQRQTGSDLSDNLAHLYGKFYRPLGMENPLFEVDSSGGFVGSSYFYASARDWARIGQLMLSKGEINGQRLLAEQWVNRAVQPNRSLNDQAYGYQFWLNTGAAGSSPRWADLPADAYAALGNRKQVMMMMPSQNVLILRLGWSEAGYPTNDNFAQLLQAVEVVDNNPSPELSTE